MNNNKHLVSLLQTGYTTVQVAFATESAADKAHAPERPWDQPRPTPVHQAAQAAVEKAVRLFRYKVRGAIAEGDLVVVDTKGGLRIATVVAVDAVPMIDCGQQFDYKWIVQRVDMTEYNQAVADERLFYEALQAIEVQKKRDDLLSAFTAQMPQGTNARALFDAAVARMSGNVPTGTYLPNNTVVPEMQDDVGMQCK